MDAILTTTNNEMEATLIMGRLSEAGIPCTRQGGVRGTPSCILVESDDMGRARAVLQADEGGFDEDELARLSEEAGRKAHATQPEQSCARPATTDGQDTDAPEPRATETGRHRLRDAFSKLTGSQRKRPQDPFAQ
jgi:hypothetical protein